MQIQVTKEHLAEALIRVKQTRRREHWPETFKDVYSCNCIIAVAVEKEFEDVIVQVCGSILDIIKCSELESHSPIRLGESIVYTIDDTAMHLEHSFDRENQAAVNWGELLPATINIMERKTEEEEEKDG